MTENGKPTWPQFLDELRASEKNVKEIVGVKFKAISDKIAVIDGKIEDIKGGVEKACQKSTENAEEVIILDGRMKKIEDGEHLDIERRKIRSKNIATWIGLIIAIVTGAGALIAALWGKGK